MPLKTFLTMVLRSLYPDLTAEGLAKETRLLTKASTEVVGALSAKDPESIVDAAETGMISSWWGNDADARRAVASSGGYLTQPSFLLGVAFAHRLLTAQNGSR